MRGSNGVAKSDQWLQAKRMNFVEYRNVIHLYYLDTAESVAASAFDTYGPRTLIIKNLELIIRGERTGAANLMEPFKM